MIAFAINTSAFAQLVFDADAADTPVDGFVSILAGAALAYGIKKSKNMANQEKK